MGCGSSKVQYSALQKGISDTSKENRPMSRVASASQREHVEHGRTMLNTQEQLGPIENGQKVSGPDVLERKGADIKSTEVLEMDKREDLNSNDVIDDNGNSNSRISNVISIEIKEGSEKHSLLKSATVDMFVEEGKKLIYQISEMPLTLEDMPQNFRKACKLRLVYHNARYNIGAKFCILYLEKIMNEGLFYCLAQAFQKLHEKWPDLFSETVDPNEVYAFCKNEVYKKFN